MTSKPKIPFNRFAQRHNAHLRSEFALLVVLAIIAGAVLVSVGVGVSMAAPTGVSEIRAVESSTGEGSSAPTMNGGLEPQSSYTFTEPDIADDTGARMVELALRIRSSAAMEAAASSEAAAASSVTSTTVTPTTASPTTTPPTTVPSSQAAAPGLPPDSYWDAMATCETGGNWQMTGSRFSGGVGFANSTWNAYGGQEFAPNAGQATRSQQIVVANRVATQGYGSVRSVGYSAWGCTARVGYP